MVPDGNDQPNKRFRIRASVRDQLPYINRSQNELGRRCGVASGYMSQLLRGTRCVGPVVRRRLLVALPDFSFDELFEEVGVREAATL